ncbi:MAG: hypothetical protein RLZZ375_334 [Pseudomonadota bacterium]|jgi:hypothetical protein
MISNAGTAAAAKVFIALSMTQAPSASSLHETNQAVFRPSPTKTYQSIRSSNSNVGSVANDGVFDTPVRETTSQEFLIGELRSWASFDDNWDGEGASRPSLASIHDAVAFARLLDANIREPEPMMLASGHAALFWNEAGLYADLEFVGNNRVAYFVQKNDDKHKGVVTFDPEKIPAVLQALLSV